MKKVLTAVAICSGLPAYGQENCAAHDAMMRQLSDGYGEVVRFMGLSSGGTLMELTVNVDTGDWTAVVSSPDGHSCIAAYGEAGRMVAPAALGEDM